MFGCITILCMSITTIILKYDGDTYLKLVGVLASLYTLGQTLTDSQRIKNEPRN
jgi:hypothetical protein